MSAPTSPSAPRSSQISSELLDFEGGEALSETWRGATAPDPLLGVADWADRHRILSSRGSAEPGPYRTERTPYMRAIMDALSPTDPCRRVVFMKAAQVGATEAGNNWIGYVIHHAPGPMLAVQPTVELAKRFSRQRLDPMIEESPVLRDLVRPARERDSGNTILSKEFAGGILINTGANSAVGLRSMPARYLFLDEVDAYPRSAEEEGDPIALATARTRTFGRRVKIFLASTPTIHGRSRIESEYEASDRRRYFVACPHCAFLQWLQFERLRWTKGSPETAAYYCEACEGRIEEKDKTELLGAGEWRATGETSDGDTVGFHISALYSPVGWMSWAEIAAMWDAAKTDEARRSFKNGVLGEAWQESGDAPDWERLYERREDWRIGTVPAGALFLTAGADVQKNRIEVSIWGWGRGLESWLIEHVVLPGGPDDAGCWAQLTRLLDRTWPHERGAQVGLARLAIDTRFERDAVHQWARRVGFGKVSPIVGVEGFNRAAPVTGPTFVDVKADGKRLRQGARIWTVATSTFKSELYRNLRQTKPTEEQLEAGADWPIGYVHLPRGVEDEWVRQLVAEQLVTSKNKKGFLHLEWQQVRDRNEALDCRVYARAAAWLLGVDRWNEARWQRLDAQMPRRGDPIPLPDAAPAAAIEAATAPPVPVAGVLVPRRPARRDYNGLEWQNQW